MPPRLSKRQQREQEELLSLAGPSGQHAGVTDDEDPDTTSQSKLSKPAIGFAAVRILLFVVQGVPQCRPLQLARPGQSESDEDEGEVVIKATKKKVSLPAF